jgi:hypothetical protein
MNRTNYLYCPGEISMGKGDQAEPRARNPPRTLSCAITISLFIYFVSFMIQISGCMHKCSCRPGLALPMPTHAWHPRAPATDVWDRLTAEMIRCVVGTGAQLVMVTLFFSFYLLLCSTWHGRFKTQIR